MTDIFSIDGLFSLPNLFTFLMLLLLQAVLGFDNLLYIAIESRRVEVSKQQKVRQLGIGLAIGFRLILLVSVLFLFSAMTAPLFSIGWTGVIEGDFTVRAVITFFGGAFIIWTAIKEIFHLLSVDHLEHAEASGKKSVTSVVLWIVAMNLVFSFDSLLTAVALASSAETGGLIPGGFWVMAASILAGGVLMIWLSDHVARFLEKNRAYEVLGLFILLVVGILLLTDAGHLAHLKLFGFEVSAMSKASFYFVIAVMVAVSVVQSKYRSKLMAAREEAARVGVPTTEPEGNLFLNKASDAD